MVKYTEAILRDAVTSSSTFPEVLEKLRVSKHGGSRDHVKKRILKMGICMAHLKSYDFKAARCNRRNKPENLFVVLPPGSNRHKGYQLRYALLSVGVPHVCAVCGIGSMWCGSKLTLTVDHINGNSLDSRQENLRFLCPNCDSQTPTYKAKNRTYQAQSGSVA